MPRYDMIWLTFRMSCSSIRVPRSQTRHLRDINRVRDCPDRSASFWIFSYLRDTTLRPWADSRAPATLRRSALWTAHDTMIDSSKQRITTQRNAPQERVLIINTEWIKNFVFLHKTLMSNELRRISMSLMKLHMGWTEDDDTKQKIVQLSRE